MTITTRTSFQRHFICMINWNASTESDPGRVDEVCLTPSCCKLLSYTWDHQWFHHLSTDDGMSSVIIIIIIIIIICLIPLTQWWLAADTHHYRDLMFTCTKHVPVYGNGTVTAKLRGLTFGGKEGVCEQKTDHLQLKREEESSCIVFVWEQNS